MEARIALELLSERLPSLRLVDNQELTYFPNITFRGPEALHLEWDGLEPGNPEFGSTASGGPTSDGAPT